MVIETGDILSHSLHMKHVSGQSNNPDNNGVLEAVDEDSPLQRAQSTLKPAFPVAGGVLEAVDEDSPLQRAQSTLKPAFPLALAQPQRENLHSGAQDDLSTEGDTGLSKDGLDWEEDDDDNNSDLVRSLTHIAGNDFQLPSTGPRGPVVLDNNANSVSRTADSVHSFQVKNTFVHIDDGNDPLRRTESTESDDPLRRTESDPTGQKHRLPQRLKRQPVVDAVPEDQPAFIELESELEASGEGASSENPLERATTYDPFTSQLPPPTPSKLAEKAAEDDGERDETLERLATYDPFATPTAQQFLQNGMVGANAPPAVSGFHMPALPVGMFPVMMPFPFQQYPAPAAPKEIGEGAPFGMLHSFHKETRGFGTVSPDFRIFTKGQDYEGRLSVLSGSSVQKGGVHRYLMQFTAGELSKADGVGFVFSSRLPCAKNIQKIVSVFVNTQGQICMRVFGNVIKAKAHVRPLRVGDWIEMAVDLEKHVATFNVWSPDPNAWGLPLPGRPDSTAEFRYGKRLAQANEDSSKPVKLNAGHFACVVQNVGVTVTMGS